MPNESNLVSAAVDYLTQPQRRRPDAWFEALGEVGFFGAETEEERTAAFFQARELLRNEFHSKSLGRQFTAVLTEAGVLAEDSPEETVQGLRVTFRGPFTPDELEYAEAILDLWPDVEFEKVFA